MSVWFYRNLGDAMLADEPLSRLTADFVESYEQAGRPHDMALFIRHESDGSLHCEVVVYFSPAAADAARAAGAVPCPTPAPDGLSLLAGADVAVMPTPSTEKPGN